MITIGAHLSIAKGFTNAANTALKIGANTFQFFSRNPRGSSVKAFNRKDIDEFQNIRKENNLGPVLAHSPYTMNLAGVKDEVYQFAKTVMKEDIKRMESIGIEYFNLHPGSHVGGGVDSGIEKIIQGIDEGIIGDEKITILLETMSGKGTEIGSNFNQLKRIINGSKYSNKLGVCLDLCHIFSAGYDLVNNLEGVLEEFNNEIGLEKLKAIHLNDSMMPFGANKDRHTPVGDGEIGLNAIINFISHPSIKKLPFFLETPLNDEGHKNEIKMIREILEER